KPTAPKPLSKRSERRKVRARSAAVLVEYGEHRSTEIPPRSSFLLSPHTAPKPLSKRSERRKVRARSAAVLEYGEHRSPEIAPRSSFPSPQTYRTETAE
ncbi:hypothetical protein QN374_17475, partial [Herbaspirillum sp. RTI4]|uniref:hypothetical protein n=1 Tax=Herbaspirillum sp. RTI4 TaxID=3048640 RepID=UPI002B23AF27